MKVKIIIPLVLGLSLIVGIIAFGGINNILMYVTKFNVFFIPVVITPILIYEYIRGREWIFFLSKLNLKYNTKNSWLAFFIGEAANDLPLGNYLQSFFLEMFEKKGIGKLSAIATFEIITEVFVCLVCIVILGVGEWSIWTRPLIIIGSFLFFLLIYFLRYFKIRFRIPNMFFRKKQKRFLENEIEEFSRVSIHLFHPKTIITGICLSIAYLIAAIFTIKMIFIGIGVKNIPILSIASAYFFGIAFSSIIPIPIDFGTLEASELGAYIALGIDKGIAISVLLIFRFFTLLSTFLILVFFMIIWNKRLKFLSHKMS